MKYRIAADARPQFRMLVLATVASLAMWMIPYASILAYPFRLFAVFIHEGGHALTAVLTGNTVSSLSVAPDGSGLTFATQGFWSGLLIDSAGYLGTMAFGVLLLLLIRRSIKSKVVLFFCAGWVALLTLGFGLLKPILTLNGLTGVPFTLVAGAALTAGLIAAGIFAGRKVALFIVSLLAVQCLLNAVFDLGNVFMLSSPMVGTRVLTDAVNMQSLTGIPPIMWAIIWIVMGFGLLMIGLRLYAVAKDSRPAQPDLPFDSPLDI